MAGANGTFEDEAPLLEGTTPHMQSSALPNSSPHITLHKAVILQLATRFVNAHASTEADLLHASLLASPQDFRDA